MGISVSDPDLLSTARGSGEENNQIKLKVPKSPGTQNIWSADMFFWMKIAPLKI